mgnify:CR=1 FL=1
MQQDQAFVVGTLYEVPCINGGGEYNDLYFPIHLPIHTDPELGQPQPHVHIDLRFLCLPDVVRSIVDPFLALALRFLGPPREAQEAVILKSMFFKVILVEPQDIVMRSMVCQRQMPPYPRHLAGWLREGGPLESYRTRCPSSDRCPHKGLPLFTGADGRRHCPGHGLCFDARNGVTGLLLRTP